MKVVRLSALRAGRLYPQEIFLVLIFIKPQGHSGTRHFISMENPSDTNGNQTHDRLACSTVSHQLHHRVPHCV